MPISDNYGIVDKCTSCTNPDVPEHCVICMCRGFVAVCLNCSGKGQTTVPVAGASSGTMSSTCNCCGGTGRFAVKKPADWDEKHAEPVEAAKAETEEEEDADFKALTAGASEYFAELDRIAKNLVATESKELEEHLARSICDDGKVSNDPAVGNPVAADHSPNLVEPATDGEMEAATDPVRPKSVHWKTWEKFGHDERIAAVEAAKAETPELASV